MIEINNKQVRMGSLVVFNIFLANIRNLISIGIPSN